MDDLYPSEPLNLVKKKKPVAVVAPSSVNEDKAALTIELDPSTDEVDKVAHHSYEHLVKSTEVEIEEQRETLPASLSSPSSKNGYSSFLATAPYDPNFLTNLYVNSLMTAGYLNNNYPYHCYPYNGNGIGSSFTPPQHSPSSKSPTLQFNSGLTNLWAQQRFWQMVNWHEARRKAELVSVAASSKLLEESSLATPTIDYSSFKLKTIRESPTSFNEPLTVAIPPSSNSTELSDCRDLSPKKHPKSHKLKKQFYR